MKKYLPAAMILMIFEAVAVALWLTKNNVFYLFNFSYIGIALSAGIFLYMCRLKNARRVVQLLVGLYMLIYLGFIRGENMQIEGFWYYPVSYTHLLPVQGAHHGSGGSVRAEAGGGGHDSVGGDFHNHNGVFQPGTDFTEYERC